MHAATASHRLGVLAAMCVLLASHVGRAADVPNIVYVMSDELGYFEPGFMGGRTIHTPNLDRLAAEGMVFRNMFAGSSVCAPSRCCFLTGKHAGHASVRSNGGGLPLRPDEETMASVLRHRGHATGGFGKWGCGARGSTGVPERQGFDLFFGYYDQIHAHTYYPPYLVRNSTEIPLPGNNGGTSGTTYAHSVIHEAALDFIREHAGRPFFAYLPYTPPHGAFSIPDDDPAWEWYRNQPWPEEARRYAAMVTMLDRHVGEVADLLRELGLERRTLLMFSGDNGGGDLWASPDHPRGVHSPNRNEARGVEFRGHKGELYEGGLRVPFFARWPGTIPAGTTTDVLAYFPDVLPTVAELCGATTPGDVDGISLVPALIGEGAAGRIQRQHDFLYWEVNGWTAIRKGSWRAVRPPRAERWELYDLAVDPGEARDVATAHPEVLAHLKGLAAAAHQPVREAPAFDTALMERDRRAKYGKQDDQRYRALPSGLERITPQDSAPNRAAKGAEIEILETKTISAQPDSYNAWPTVGLGPAGAVWLVYSGGREYHLCPFGQVHAMVSRDGGETWSQPRILLDTPLDDRDAGFLKTAAGTLLVTTVPARSYESILQTGMAHVRYENSRWTDAPLEPAQRLRWEAAFKPVHAGRMRPGQVVIRSTDGGRTWSEPIDTLVNAPHGPIQLRDGRLLYAGKQWWIPTPKMSVAESLDDGKTWTLIADVPVREGDAGHSYCEPHAVEAIDGSIVMQWRYHGVGIMQAMSRDGGRTWSEPRPLFYGFPPHLLRLKDGRLLSTYGHRRKPFGNQARISDDQGATWGGPLVISGDVEQVDLGYPSSVELADGLILTTWYQWVADTRRGVIRQAKWKLPE